MKKYAYFFTRQDISPEQQIVQTAHAALKLGYKARERDLELEVATIEPLELGELTNPDETYFTLIGVSGLTGLLAVETILTKFGFKYEVFCEPDLRNEPTSIAVYPILEDQRGPLMAFSLLKISKL